MSIHKPHPMSVNDVASSDQRKFSIRRTLKNLQNLLYAQIRLFVTKKNKQKQQQPDNNSTPYHIACFFGDASNVITVLQSE